MRILFSFFFLLFFTCISSKTYSQAPKQFNNDEQFVKDKEKKKDNWWTRMRTKRCPIKSCDTKMIHMHNGKKFRGRQWWRCKQNPKTGELVREPVTDPKKRKKSSKVKKNHEYQKEYKLPEKSN